ncbi:DUF3575 domain-containing protein [Lacihabitans sp. LS3-19]|uniref:DUF3575 domain-containing protein n=1 Tax=Lacihabitans sp. LS3-19 TaxID=2487335 RepID=UPI00286E5BE3|nr:DUF3575 domain-containing protein [Lacihabitans sp. LS3-19]MCP9767083.1 DUF3575 domain-containing protein [Lacihabitans sp. LS3-19]
MRKSIFYILIILLVMIRFTNAFSQNKKNLVKVNLTSLAFKTGSVQLERILSKNISFGLSGSIMPNTQVPFAKQLNKIKNEDYEKSMELVNTSFYSVTPEIRFYMSKKGYGHGFYFAPFYRHGQYNIENTDAYYGLNDSKTINTIAKLKTNTGGFSLGAQWHLGNRLTLDWIILGPHFGNAKVNWEGIVDNSLTSTDQSEMREEFRDYEFIFSGPTSSEVSEKGFTNKYNEYWGGIRAGISLGFRF